MQAYRFRAEPLPIQQRWAAKVTGANRWIYNEGRKYCIYEYRLTGNYPGYVALCKKLTEWRAQHPWLREGVCDAQQQVLADLDNAYKRFFKKLGDFPKKKTRKKSTSAMRFPQGAKIKLEKLSKKDSALYLPKIGRLRFRQSRKIEGKIRSVTLKRDRCFNWDILVLTDHEPVDSKAFATDSEVGIDMGVARTATLSDGTFFKVPTPSKRDAAHLAKLQRRLARRTKDSKRHGRARLAIAKFHKTWQDRRNDTLHKQTSKITRENQAIYVEDLKVKNMTKRCKGKGRAAKAGLNKVILQQGWGMAREMLKYKSLRRNRVFDKVNPAYTSQECSKCHHIDSLNRVSQAVFCCVKCEHTENADANAAKNIKAAGQAASARGRSVRPVKSSTSVRSILANRLKREPVGTSSAGLIPAEPCPGILCL